MKSPLACRRPNIIAIAVGLSFLFLTPTVLAQIPSSNQSEQNTKQNGDDPYIYRWKIFLDSLAQESRTVFPEERRIYAIVDVANAYWEVDQQESRSLYSSALDTAASLTKQDKKHRPLLNYVLSSATRLDAKLANALNKRLLDDKDAGNRDSLSSKTALDLLDENPEAATQLAEAFAPNGLQDGTAAFLIISLAKKDVRLSNRVHNVYVSRVTAGENIPLEWILPLAGYSFGYSEYYSVDKRGQLGGVSFLPIAGLFANPAVATSFLNLAFRRLSMSIERRNQAVGGDVEALNFPILFSSGYLMPEVARFSPNTLPAWEQLQQQGVVGTTVEQNQRVQAHLLQINQARARTKNFSDNSQTPEQEAEASLENVEKLTGTCQRDVVYSKAALTLSSRRNFKRALEIAEKIENLKQADNVKEVIFIATAEAAIAKGEWEEAHKIAQKISSPEQKAVLLVELAGALTKKKDHQQSTQIVNDATKLTEKLSKDADKAGVSFGLSSILLKTDPVEAQTIMASAIKSLNKQEPVDRMRFSVPMKVSLSCLGEDTWYGGFKSLPNSIVFDAIATFAKNNPDDARQLAEDINDKITKIRSLAVITRIALASKKASR